MSTAAAPLTALISNSGLGIPVTPSGSSLRSCLKRSHAAQSAQHESDHGTIDHAFTGCRAAFIIFAQPSIVVQPRKGSFNHPPTWHDHKPFLVIRAEYHGQLVATMGRDPYKQLPTIPTIDPHPPQIFARTTESTQHEFGPIPIVDGCGGDRHRHQQAHGINNDMAFASTHFFTRIIPAHTTNRGRFDTLTSETARCRVWMPTRFPSYCGPQRVMNALTRAIIAPASEVMIDTFPGWVVCRQHPPLDSPYHEIHEAIDDLPHVQASWSSARFRRWD